MDFLLESGDRNEAWIQSNSLFLLIFPSQVIIFIIGPYPYCCDLEKNWTYLSFSEETALAYDSSDEFESER